MKKALFAAFAGVCILSSFTATSTDHRKMETGSKIVMNSFWNDSVPGRKTDTSRYPKPTDTTSMPKLSQEIK